MGGGGDVPEIEETAAERALAEVSAAKFRSYQENFKPLEQRYMDRVDNMDGESYQRSVATMAGNNATQDMRAAEQSMYQGGINPNSGGFAKKSAVLSDAIAKTKASAMSSGIQSAQNSYLQGLANVNAIGAGQEAVATNSTRQLADMSAAEARANGQNDFTRYQSNQEATGAVVGGLAAAGSNYLQSSGGQVYDNRYASQSGGGLVNTLSSNQQASLNAGKGYGVY